jgi:two-component system, cell cycle sensor histidine kinase and response regulator CckA
LLAASDRRGQITLINHKVCDILGYSEGELLGRNWFVVCLASRHNHKTSRLFDQLIAGHIEPAESFENPVLTNDGKDRLLGNPNVNACWRSHHAPDSDHR